MFILKTIGCRLFQLAFRAVLPILPYRQPKILASCRELGEMLKQQKASSVLIVTDTGIVKNGLCQTLEAVLAENNIRYTMYDGTQPNPTVSNVEEAHFLYRDHQCDTLIAIGGGSAMDCAKAVGVRAVYPHRTLGQLSGILRVHRALPTLIAIPTTAGTGSEVTSVSVISNKYTEDKFPIKSEYLLPKIAIIDPELTRTVPKKVTASSGIDVLSHALESYYSKNNMPYRSHIQNVCC